MAKRFRVLVTGSQTWPYPEMIKKDLAGLYAVLGDLMEIVESEYRDGPDQISKTWAKWANVDISPSISQAEMAHAEIHLCLAYVHSDSPEAADYFNKAIDAGIPALIRHA